MSFCDQQLGRVLDVFDRYNLWEDTLLLVNTDHGFLMGEHDWWAKVVAPFFQEVAHILFWAYDPRAPELVNQSRESLAQTIDLAPTILDFFDIPIPKDMQGKPLFDAMASDRSPRAASLYGVMGGQVNVTDGRYVYMRGNVTEDNGPLFEYTLMPTHMRSRFTPAELQEWERWQGFSFLKGCKVMRIPARTPRAFLSNDTPQGSGRRATLLFDLAVDPEQLEPLKSPEIEFRMIELMIREMAINECPSEQYQRLGLPEPNVIRGNGDKLEIKMPSVEAVQAACLLGTEHGGKEVSENRGGGWPKMPFPGTVELAEAKATPWLLPESIGLLEQYQEDS